MASPKTHSPSPAKPKTRSTLPRSCTSVTRPGSVSRAARVPLRHRAMIFPCAFAPARSSRHEMHLYTVILSMAMEYTDVEGCVYY
jgi:hypothetical protein